MKEYCGSHFVLNSEIKTVEDFDNSMVIKGETIYEVIRMVRGTPVFFSDHMKRLEASVNRQGKRMITDAEVVRSSIVKLTETERRKEINIKIVFNYNEVTENFLVYYIESSYPTAGQYKNGVKGILFWAERNNPQSKVLDYRMRSAIHQELLRDDAYEAVLVNNDNLITEGSKSNIFFVKGNNLVTAPDEMILKGVTRKHILDICQSESIDVDFRCVNADNLGEYDSAFITGTSPMVLPYCCINEIYFNVKHPMTEKLRKLYMERAEKSLKEFRESGS